MKCKVTGDIAYLCYTSNAQKVDGEKLGYSRLFVVADTDEEMKIVDYWLFIDSKWVNNIASSHKILKYGSLVETKKFVAPEDEISLKDYNEK